MNLVNYDRVLNVSDRVRNLSKGYELYCLNRGKVKYKEQRIGSIVVVNEESRKIIFDEKGRNGWDIIYPSEDIKDWRRFYAPAKDELVSYIINFGSNTVYHIAGKWFSLIDETVIEMNPVYISDEIIKNKSYEDIGFYQRLLYSIFEELGLYLRIDTLEWSYEISF